MSILIKSQRVLDLDQYSSNGVYFHKPDEDGGSVIVLRFDLTTWEDMGRPTKLTITLEPGDTLNEHTG